MFTNPSIEIINRYHLLDDDKFCTFYHYILDILDVRLNDIGLNLWYFDVSVYNDFVKVDIHMCSINTDSVRINESSTNEHLPILKEFYSIKIELLELLTDIGYVYSINQNTLLSFMFDIDNNLPKTK